MKEFEVDTGLSLHIIRNKINNERKKWETKVQGRKSDLNI